jgi:tellurite methyltransferase
MQAKARSSQWSFLSPSPTLLRLIPQFPRLEKSVTLDVACGYGRNAILMAAHGSAVVCVDRDLARLRQIDDTKAARLNNAPTSITPGHLTTVCADLSEMSWPFAANTFDVIIVVHFVAIRLIPCLLRSLKQDGHIYIETFGGQGENYLTLPHPGELKQALISDSVIIYYREKPASRAHKDVVTVKMLARNKRQLSGLV